MIEDRVQNLLNDACKKISVIYQPDSLLEVTETDFDEIGKAWAEVEQTIIKVKQTGYWYILEEKLNRWINLVLFYCEKPNIKH